MPVANPPSRLFIGAFLLGITCTGGMFLLGRHAYETHRPAVTLQRPHVLLGKVLEKGPFELRVDGIGERAGHVYQVVYGAQTHFFRLAPWKPGEKEQAQKDYETYLAKLPPGTTNMVPPPPLTLNVLYTSLADIPVGTPVGIVSNDVIPAASSVAAMAEVVRPLLPDEITDGSVATSFPFR